MTVNVTKSSLNVREKLKELERPIGVKGNELMRAETAQDARDLVSAGRKNMIINGDMRIDQRSYGSATTPSTTSFTSVDRWKAVINPASKFSMQRKTDGTVPGLPYYLRVTTTTALSPSGSQYQLIWQPIEGINVFDQTAFGYTGAKDLSLSFWVRSSIPGAFSGVLENVGQNYAYIWEVNINQANTWEYKTVSIPGNTSGSWNTASTSTAAYLMFSMGTDISGTANAGWVNAQRLSSDTEVKRIATLGATLDLTGIQLEVGKNATEFENRSYAEELALCQRYYQNSYHQSAGKYPGNTDNDNGMIQTCWSDGNSPFGMFPTPMRTQPSVTLRQRGTNNIGKVEVGGAQKTASAQQITNQGIGYISVTSGVAGSWCAFTYELDAEL